jgi:hypothetical protein
MSNPLLSLVVGACVIGALGACSSVKPATQQPAESLSVRELNIVDEKGQARLRIGAPLPDPKGLKRAVTAYGIQFMDSSGKEVGGLAMLEPVGISGLCFDAPENYEAICLGYVQGQPNIIFRQDWKDRISIGVDKGVATIVINDGEGRTQLRLEVDKDGKTRVEGVTPVPAGK